MYHFWLGFICLQIVAEVTNKQFWIGIGIIVGSIATSAFLAGVAFNKKANKSDIETAFKDVIMRPEYLKDMKSINDDLSDFAQDLEVTKEKVETHIELYHTIDKKLDLLAKDVSYIKENCPKGECKTKPIKK